MRESPRLQRHAAAETAWASIMATNVGFCMASIASVTFMLIVPGWQLTRQGFEDEVSIILRVADGHDCRLPYRVALCALLACVVSGRVALLIRDDDYLRRVQTGKRTWRQLKWLASTRA